jgi:hypothetical protein
MASTIAKAKFYGLMVDRGVVKITHNYAMR